MKVRDFCSRTVAVIEPDATLREAALLMRNGHVGARPEGIRVRDVMSPQLLLAREQEAGARRRLETP